MLHLKSMTPLTVLLHFYYVYRLEYLLQELIFVSQAKRNNVLYEHFILRLCKHIEFLINLPLIQQLSVSYPLLEPNKFRTIKKTP